MTRCGASDYLDALEAASATPLECEGLAAHQKSAAGRILAMLRDRAGAILADDAGLGKSYVAAAVMKAMQRNGCDVRLIVPAMLRGQWAATLEKFDVPATLTTHDALRNDPTVPATATNRLVVVDEAHRFRNPATERYDALARFSVGARCLLITATPLCNSLGDLRALVELIAADDAMAALGVPSIADAFDGSCRAAIKLVVRTLVIRRGRNVLTGTLRFGALRRNVVGYQVDSSGGEVAAAIEGLEFPAVPESATRKLLKRFLWRRLESSPAALGDSVARQLRFYRRALAALRDGREMPKSLYRAAFAAEDDEGPMQEVLFWDLWLPRSDAATTAANDLNGEIERLAAIRSSLGHFVDRKAEILLGLLQRDEPALVFTSSIATARSLHAIVSTTRRSALLTSGGGRDARGRPITVEQALFLFTSGAVDVLICTDMAGEGLNLQRAGVVIHYDLPWNPVRLDQRNGRIHRIGQVRDEVRAVYFLPDRGEGGSGVVSTIARKNRLRRRTLPSESAASASAGSILGTQLVTETAGPTIALVDFGSFRRVIEEPGFSRSETDRGVRGEIAPLDASLFCSVLQCSESAAEARSLLRPVLGEASPAAILARRLAEQRLLDARSKTLLARSYRAGVNRLLRITARGFLDAIRRDELLAILEAELRLCEELPAESGVVLAGIIGRPRIDEKPETRNQKSEIRNQKSEIRNQKSETSD